MFEMRYANISNNGEQQGYIDLRVNGTVENTDAGTLIASYEVEGLSASQAFRFNTHMLSTEHIPLRLEAVQLNDDNEEEVLASYDIAYDAEAVLEGTTKNNNPVRLLLKTTGGNTTVRIFNLAAQTIDVVTGSYIALICNDQFGLSKDYRFGFNGQEMDNEVKGIGNSLDFGARIYDSRLGRWLSIDPLSKKYAMVTPYAFCASSPIIFRDIKGMDLDISGDTRKALADLQSIIAPEYRSLLTVVDGKKIVFDISTLSQDQIRNDAGTDLLNRMINVSDKKYLYSVETSNPNTGVSLKQTDGIQNNSVEPRLEHNRSGDNVTPGYDGEVIIHPNAVWIDADDNGQEFEEPRGSTVFHELEENYQRTDEHKKYMYIENGRKDVSREGAHDIAIKKAEKLTPSAKKPNGREGIGKRVEYRER